MPKPKDGESEKDFVDRCIPMVMHDGSAESSDQAVAMCHTMFKQHKEANGGDMSPDMGKNVTNELKALSETPEELRVGNYIILFGGRDLTAFPGVGDTRQVFKNADGSAGEFFSKRTQLESDYTAMGRLPLDWEHGDQAQTEGLGEDDLLGYVDWGTKRIDEGKGVWVERVLNRRKEYVKWVEELIRAGLVGSSARTVPGHGRKTAAGEIVEWPLYRDTLTVQPAEPRMLTGNVVSAMKALGIEPKSITTPATAENEPEQDGRTVSPAVSPAAASANHKKSEPSTVKGLTDMDEAQMQAFLDAREAAKEARVQAEAKAKADRDEAVKTAIANERKVWEAELKNAGRRGGYATGVEDPVQDFDIKAVQNANFTKSREAYWRSSTATRDVAKAMKGYIRYEVSQDELGDALKAEAKASNNTDMNIATPGDGGVAVPVGHYQGIIAKCDESALYGPLGIMPIPGVGTTVDVPFDNGTANVFVSTAETVGFDNDAPALDKAQMTLVKYTKDITLSDELMQDEDSKLMAFLDNYVGRALARTYNSLLLTALGTGATAYTMAGASTVAAGDVNGIVFAIKDCYADGAKWLMKRTTEGIVRGLTGNFWQFAPTPAGAGYGSNGYGSNSTLWNYPIYHSEFATAPAASAKSIYFGDFSYVGMRNGGLSFLRDPYSKASNGQLLLHYYTRTVFKVLIAEAILRGTHPSA